MNFTIHEKLQKAECSLEQTLNSLDLQDQLFRFGFSSAHLKEGKELLDRANRYYLEYKHQSSLEYDCYNDLYQKKEQSHQSYVEHLRRIKPALKNQLRFWKELETAESSSKGMSGWIQRLQDFYQLLLNDTYYLSRVQMHGLERNDFQQGLSQIIAVKQAFQKQQKIGWTTRQAKNKLEQAMHEFEDWNREFKSILQLALLENGNSVKRINSVA